MKLIDKFFDILVSLNNLIRLPSNKSTPQFLINDLDGQSYLLGLADSDDNGITFNFVHTQSLEHYSYKAVINVGFKVYQPEHGLSELLQFVLDTIVHYQYRFDFDVNKKLETLRGIINDELANYSTTYVSMEFDESNVIKVQVNFVNINCNFEVPYLLDDVVNAVGIIQLLETLLALEDTTNDKITDEESEENERLETTVFEIVYFYDLINLMIDDNRLIKEHILPMYEMRLSVEGEDNAQYITT